MSFERSSTDRFNQDFPCQLCNERLSTENEMRYHLLTCGSKTELCPHCKKYIKRSYFAYHIDNNCANLNLFDEVREKKHHNKFQWNFSFRRQHKQLYKI
jgi:hypothetical protein